MTAKGRAFVDANVLVYMVDHDVPTKRDAARTLVLDALGSGSLALSTQVLQEFFWVSTRRLVDPLHPVAASALVRQLHSAYVVAPSFQMVLAAMERSAESGAPIWDTLILTAAEASGADVLYTEDHHLPAMPGSLRVVDPFTPD